MTVFACDFFLMTPAILGAVDAVYDRGALTAITPQDRQSYIAVMKNLLSPEFRLVRRDLYIYPLVQYWIA